MSENASISKPHALFLAGVISSSYVTSVYLSLLIAEPKAPLWRNDPTVIRVRSILASAMTLFCCRLVYDVLRDEVHKDSTVWRTTLDYIGLPFGSHPLFSGTWKAYWIVPVLFAGPIYATHLQRALPFQQNWDVKRDLIYRFTTWEGFRNYIMGPITEEITYRSCVLSVYKLAGFSRMTMIWVAPCWFGLAHIHHASETFRRLGRTSAALRTALITALFQFAYTTLFGWLCSFLFLRTGSIIVPISAHVFCNIMGFPAITWELKQFPSNKISIIVAYISGVALFSYSLFPWSYNSASLYWT